MSSGSTHHDAEQMKHRGDEIHTNLQQFPLRSRDFFDPIHPLAKANLQDLVQCFLEFLTMEISLACHVPLPKRPFRLQFTDWSDATID